MHNDWIYIEYTEIEAKNDPYIEHVFHIYRLSADDSKNQRHSHSYDNDDDNDKRPFNIKW